MMRHAVVAFPKLSDGDAAWLEGIRTSHDPVADRIRAHFTLVFPLRTPVEALVAHAGACAAAHAPARCTIGSTRGRSRATCAGTRATSPT